MNNEAWFGKHRAYRRETRRRPQLEVLEDRLLLSASFGEIEPNNRKGQATSFSFPEDGIVQLSGTSLSKSDKDFFVFTAAATGTVDVQVSYDGAPAKLKVENSLGVKVFETEPNDGNNGGTMNVVAGQTYFLRLRSQQPTSSAYLVDLVFSGGGGGGGGGVNRINETENNNKKSMANPFTLDDSGTAVLVGTSQNKDDKDFFVFTAPRSGTLSVTVQTTNGRFAKVEVEDQFSVDILETDPSDGINSARGSVIAGRTYYVRVRSEDLLAAGYEVDLSLT